MSSDFETRFERIMDMERKFARRPEGWTTSELAQEYDVNQTTIQRDISMLEMMGTGLIKEGWRYKLDHRRALYTLKLTNHEMMALYIAARLLSRYSDEHNPHVVKAIEKVADAVRDRAPDLARHIDQAAEAVRERRARPEYLEAMETLTLGWVQHRKVRLRYRSYTKDETTERIFAPYYIEPSAWGYACYVIGYDELRGALRTLKIERIAAASLTDEPFAIAPTFDPRKKLASAWGIIWSDDDPITITLRFAPSVVRRVKESMWHHSQHVEDLPDGACLFTVQVGSLMEFKPWVRQWGAAVEVISPPAFRDEMIAEVREMAALYGLGK